MWKWNPTQDLISGSVLFTKSMVFYNSMRAGIDLLRLADSREPSLDIVDKPLLLDRKHDGF